MLLTITMPDVALDAFLLAAERQLEALDRRLVLCVVGVRLQVHLVIVAAGDDDVGLQVPEPLDIELLRIGFLKRRDGVLQRGVDILLVAHGRLARRGDDLRLVAVREDMP